MELKEMREGRQSMIILNKINEKRSNKKLLKKLGFPSFILQIVKTVPDWNTLYKEFENDQETKMKHATHKYSNIPNIGLVTHMGIVTYNHENQNNFIFSLREYERFYETGANVPYLRGNVDFTDLGNIDYISGHPTTLSLNITINEDHFVYMPFARGLPTGELLDIPE